MVALYFADWRLLPLTAAAVGLLSHAMYRLLHRVPRTTVYCRRCPGSGWIDDLRAHDGACPHCGNARFDYRGTRYTGVSMSMPLTADDVSGAWLLQS